MSINIPTTQELFEQNLENYQNKINQESPLNDRAFLRVASQNEAGAFTILYKYGQERALQNLALTATGSDLDNIGAEYSLPRNPATASEYTATLPATDGTIIPGTTIFTGVNNSVKYISIGSATASSESAVLTLRATVTGEAGNDAGSFRIQSQIAGAQTTATLTSQTVTGASAETDEAYRLRILERIQNPPQGGAPTDYRIWSKTVSGVKNAFPYSGLTYPNDITVYVEATTAVAPPDGIPSSTLLDQVENAILYDEDGLRNRMPLGVANLYVNPISRINLYTTIIGLTVDNEATVKSEIEAQIDTFYRSREPYIQGLTLVNGRSDTITAPDVASVVNDIVRAAGGSVQNVTFGITVGGVLSQYILTGGQLAKSGGVTYA